MALLHDGRRPKLVWDHADLRDWIAFGCFLAATFHYEPMPKPSPMNRHQQNDAVSNVMEVVTKWMALLRTPKAPAVRLPKCVLGKDKMTVSGKPIPFTRSMSKVARTQIHVLPTIDEQSLEVESM
ncbi:hypothetical protein H310_00734 [Aphanomyces invadans]|uniref:Uncharacterized protein n=1 Tax=Aphanomyces invadans TaxID=157072 RepID=A0A024UWX9_9STRA|nr:hypothetical protein H310_00734 [Aphanomyces invadans]ETW10427.1 hypothetical protein H310_00734 [Aphanomyces invadans]|eukprot:XP_008861838.1 hypothetical protein H310_00734 [Aphanomyces invadans]